MICNWIQNVLKLYYKLQNKILNAYIVTKIILKIQEFHIKYKNKQQNNIFIYIMIKYLKEIMLDI